MTPIIDYLRFNGLRPLTLAVTDNCVTLSLFWGSKQRTATYDLSYFLSTPERDLSSELILKGIVLVPREVKDVKKRTLSLKNLKSIQDINRG